MFTIRRRERIIFPNECLRVFFVVTAESVNDLLCFYAEPAKRFLAAISRVHAARDVPRFQWLFAREDQCRPSDRFRLAACFRGRLRLLLPACLLPGSGTWQLRRMRG